MVHIQENKIVDVRIDEDGTLHIEANTETESYALLQWWNGWFTKKNEIRQVRTTDIEVHWVGKRD